MQDLTRRAGEHIAQRAHPGVDRIDQGITRARRHHGQGFGGGLCEPGGQPENDPVPVPRLTFGDDLEVRDGDGFRGHAEADDFVVGKVTCGRDHAANLPFRDAHLLGGGGNKTPDGHYVRLVTVDRGKSLRAVHRLWIHSLVNGFPAHQKHGFVEWCQLAPCEVVVDLQQQRTVIGAFVDVGWYLVSAQLVIHRNPVSTCNQLQEVGRLVCALPRVADPAQRDPVLQADVLDGHCQGIDGRLIQLAQPVLDVDVRKRYVAALDQLWFTHRSLSGISRGCRTSGAASRHGQCGRRSRHRCSAARQ